MRIANHVIKSLLGLKECFLPDCTLQFESLCGEEYLVIEARPHKRHRSCCPYCGRRCPFYDRSTQVARWRAMDLGRYKCFIEANVPRIKCPEHGVVTPQVPWAFPHSRFTKDFDRTTAWLAKNASKTTVSEFMRIDWKTVGRCVSRVREDVEPDLSDRLKGVKKIGIDETSYAKGHKYMTLVVNHENNEVIYVADGTGTDSLRPFFEKLSPEQRESITAVSADGARWIWSLVDEYLPNAAQCLDGFHVVSWATELVDELRRRAWQKSRQTDGEIRKELVKTKKRYDKADTERKRARAGQTLADLFEKLAENQEWIKALKGAKYALGKGEENLTEAQQVRRETIVNLDADLQVAVAMKEELRRIFKMADKAQLALMLRNWIENAQASTLEGLRTLGEKIQRHEAKILMTVVKGLSNARIEATNNKIKVLIRRSYGFRSMKNLFDLIYLICSNARIGLPWEYQ